MKNARTAVFGWHFSFVLATIVCILILISLVGCDTQNMEDLLNSTDCTVTFVLNNGEENVVWRKGDQVPAPSKKDCDFLYWCSDSDLTTRADIDFDNFVLASSITVYAKWKELDDLSGVKFDSVECYYDGNAHEVEVDKSTLPEGALVTYDKQTSYVDAGEYVVTATIKADGYKDLVLSATVKIKKAILQGITFDPVVIDWDGQLHGAFVAYENGELPSGVSVTYIGNGQREVGVYDIIAKFETSANYEPIADMQTTLAINEKYFSVTFDDGISQPVVRLVAHGQSLEDIPAPSAKTGYDGAWERTVFENILEDVTVSADYTPHEYTVAFVSAGETIATKNYNIETAITFDDESREHYVFEGWFANESFSGNCETGIEVGNYGDKTYYAKWRAIEYYVTYHVGDGLNDTNNENCDGKYKYTVESEALTLKAPTRKFYVFDGWYTDENFEGESVAVLRKGASGNLDLYAKWTPQRFEVSYDTKGGVNDECNPSFTTIESGELELLPATKDDFEFVCWIDVTGSPVTSIKAHNVEPVSLTAVWKEKVYTVNYETNGGIATANKTSYTASDGTITLGESRKRGYVFDGWYENEDLSGERVDEIHCSARRNLTLYAAWKLEKYSIEYDLAGGKNNPNPNSYTIESDDIVLLAPEKDGYSFDGWFDEDGNEVDKIAKDSVGNALLSARWSVVEYIITFDSNGGDEVNSYIYTVESENYTLPSANRSYYDFAGWFDENENEVVKIESVMLKSFTLTAKWTAHVYTITYDFNGGTEVENPTSYTVETETFALAEPTREGYTFEGWFDVDLNVTQIEKGCHADIKLTARWIAVEYTITFDSNGGDEVNSYIYTVESENYTLPSANRSYYDFAGWFDENGKQVKTIESSMLKSFTLTAQWTAHVYTITYDFNGGAEVKNPTSYTVETETFALLEPTKVGYTFDGWYDGELKVTQIEKGCHADIKLTAKWSATEYIVTFDSNGGDEVNPYIYTVESDNYTLPSANRNYYDFVGWFDENGNEVVKIESAMLKSFTLTAKWTAHVYTITYDFNGGTEVKNPTSYTVETETFALAEPTREGYTFEGWYNDNVKVAQIEKGSHADIALVAKWEEEVVVLPSDFTVENGILTAYNGSDNTIVVHATEAGQKILSIAKTAFYSVRDSVTEIVIEEGVESFEQGTFDGMSNLVTLSLPSTITTMYKGMLTDCKSLTNLMIPFASFNVTKFNDKNDISDSGTIYNDDSTENAAVGFTYLFGNPQDATEYVSCSEYLKDLQAGTVGTIGTIAYIPKSLKNVTVLGGNIMDKGFCGINVIESLTYGGEYLGNFALKGCTGLSKVYIQNENATFGSTAFSGCKNMTIYVATEAQKAKVNELGLANVICEVASN